MHAHFCVSFLGNHTMILVILAIQEAGIGTHRAAKVFPKTVQDIGRISTFHFLDSPWLRMITDLVNVN